jgi:hypothetical protein
MMNSERIEQIQDQTPYKDSQSVFNALHQVWNEVGQEYLKENQKLKARVAEFENIKPLLIEICCFTQEFDLLWWQKKAREIYYMLGEHPKQSLAEIKAEVIMEFVTECSELIGKEPDAIHREMAIEYANRLKAEGK